MRIYCFGEFRFVCLYMYENITVIYNKYFSSIEYYLVVNIFTLFTILIF